MAVPYVALLPVGLVFVAFLRWCLSLRRNIAIAKASGIPFVVAPWAATNVLWAITDSIISPLLCRLPVVKDSITMKALMANTSWRTWRETHEALGDVWMVVSPYGFYLNTTNAEVTNQITSRKYDFPKPLEDYVSVKVFGDNMLASDGDDWKRHRKIVAPSFSEKSNALVWEDTIRQTEGLLSLWGRIDGNSPKDMRVQNADPYWATMALHVICAAGFGVPQTWPGEGESVLGTKVVPGFNTEKLLNNHKLTFKKSLHELGLGFLWLFALSPALLARSPFKFHNRIADAVVELSQYFNELVEYKIGKIAIGEQDEGTMDLLGPLIQANEQATGGTKGKTDEKSIIASGGLTHEEITGNAFIFMFAGHETSAGTLHYASLLLAIHRDDQLRLQEDVDRIVGTREPSTWTYKTDMGNLFNSMIGAVQNEQLRLLPAVICPPKRATRDRPQTVTMDGKTLTVPAGTYIHLNAVGSGRNPRYWPSSPSKTSDKPNDLDEFVPSRWFVTPSSDSEDSSIIFKPLKGSFITFSDGQRACPGRRFAQVEITAVLAVLFQKYSVELDVGMFASDEEVAKMGFEERKIVYQKARKRAEELIRASIPIITLRMRGESVPLRFVRRGLERFAGC